MKRHCFLNILFIFVNMYSKPGIYEQPCKISYPIKANFLPVSLAFSPDGRSVCLLLIGEGGWLTGIW